MRRGVTPSGQLRRRPDGRQTGVNTAATHGGFDSVRLHHTDPLDELPHVRDLHDLPNFELVLLSRRLALVVLVLTSKSVSGLSSQEVNLIQVVGVNALLFFSAMSYT